MNEYNYGSYLLPEYGLGSWLKTNAGTLMQGAGKIASLLPPPISAIAGPIGGLLNIAGGAVNNIQDRKAQNDMMGDMMSGIGEGVGGEQVGDFTDQQAALDKQAKMQADAAAAQKSATSKANYQQNLNARRENLNVNDTINYGGLAEFGGDMNGMLQSNVGDPMITEYSDKAFKHGEGPNGVPVDTRGNPTSVSNSSAIGLTEGGEVTWNGYVFSNQMKYKK